MPDARPPLDRALEQIFGDPESSRLAVHLPWIDRLFGTRHLPEGRWPAGYGIAGHPVPEGYLGQLVSPLRGPAAAPAQP